MQDAPGKESNLRSIPSVDSILNAPRVKELLNHNTRWLILMTVREVLEEFRVSIERRKSPLARDDAFKKTVGMVLDRLTSFKVHSIKQVINGTGVIIHTNLGRAPLASEAISLIQEVALGYSNLEYVLAEGKRGERTEHVRGLLLRLTGAKEAFAINNNAAAVFLALNSLADNREVIISRGELVEIGGTFRIPDVIKKSGAIMREVGTTNRTHLSDYENAITENTALILKVHTSNYKIIGFSTQVCLKDLVGLGRKKGIPVMMDLGSGNLTDLSIFGLKGEPTIPQILSTGVDVVTFSGDKLLGGPQAGIILTQGKIPMSSISMNPIARALRIDKLSLAGLEATLMLYQKKDHTAYIPVLKMISISPGELMSRASVFLSDLEKVNKDTMKLGLQEGVSSIGGGSLPAETLPTFLISFSQGKITVEALEAAFRSSSPPVIGRIQDDMYLLDLRTIREDELPCLVNIYKSIVEK